MARVKKTAQVVVRMTEELNAEIEAAASRRGLSMAAWARQLFIEALEHPTGSKDQQSTEALCGKD